MLDYSDFIEQKSIVSVAKGFDVPLAKLKPELYGSKHQYQPLIVQWALKIGCAAIFAKYGLGKTRMQLEWAKHICKLAKGRVIVLAPLAVAQQTEQEASKYGIDSVEYCRTAKDIAMSNASMVVTNYERLKDIDTSGFVGVVLDESSILKNYTGKTKELIFSKFADTPYKLCCSATPSPNNHLELINHSDFLGVEKTNRTLSKYFINDTMNAGGYILKPYARDAFWRWVSSWAVCITKPSDLGFNDDGWDIPKPNMVYHTISVDHTKAWETADKNGQISLIRMPSNSATSANKEGRLNAEDLAQKIAELVQQRPNESWVIWCFTNYESDALQAALPDAVDLRGDDKPKVKEQKLDDFSSGKIKLLITKPKIAGMGLNWQHSWNQAFVMGTSYSFESFHQAMHRLVRFGQTKTVNTHMVFPETAGNVRAIFSRKEKSHHEMQNSLIEAISKYGLGAEVSRKFDNYNPTVIATVPDWIKTAA